MAMNVSECPPVELLEPNLFKSECYSYSFGYLAKFGYQIVIELSPLPSLAVPASFHLASLPYPVSRKTATLSVTVHSQNPSSCTHLRVKRSSSSPLSRRPGIHDLHG